MAVHSAVPGRVHRPWMLGDAASDAAAALQALQSATPTVTGALAAQQSGGGMGLFNFLTGGQQTPAQQVTAAVTQSSWTKYVLIAAVLGGGYLWWSSSKKKAS